MEEWFQYTGFAIVDSYVLQAKGNGYAMNTSNELKFVKEVASATSVIDHVC